MFQERLIKAIQSNNIEAVQCLLDALLEYNKNASQKLTILPKLLLDGSSKNAPSYLYHHVLNTKNVELFKLFIRFYKDSRDHVTNVNEIDDDLVYVFYRLIYLKKLELVEFFIEEIGIDLLKPVHGFLEPYDSPLMVAIRAHDEEMFLNVIFPCIIANKKADKDVSQTLIAPAKNFANRLVDKNEITKEYHDKISRLLQIYEDIYVLFLRQKMLTLTSLLSDAYQLDSFDCVGAVGQFFQYFGHTLVSSATNDKAEQFKKISMSVINGVVKTIDCYISEEDDEGKRSELRAQLMSDIIPHYLVFVNAYKRIDNTEEKKILYEDAKRYLQQHKIVSQETFVMGGDDSNTVFDVLEVLPKAAAPMKSETKYQLALLYAENKMGVIQAIDMWIDLVIENQHQDSLKQLQQLCKEPKIASFYTLHVCFYANAKLGQVYWDQQVKVSDKDKEAFVDSAAVNHWVCALKIANLHQYRESEAIKQPLKILHLSLTTFIQASSMDQKNRETICVHFIHHLIQNNHCYHAKYWMDYGAKIFSEYFVASTTKKIVEVANKFIEKKNYNDAIAILELGIIQFANARDNPCQEALSALQKAVCKMGESAESLKIIQDSKTIREQEEKERLKLNELEDKVSKWFELAAKQHFKNMLKSQSKSAAEVKEISPISIFRKENNPELLAKSINFVNGLFNDRDHNAVYQQIDEYLDSNQEDVRKMSPLIHQLKQLLRDHTHTNRGPSKKTNGAISFGRW